MYKINFLLNRFLFLFVFVGLTFNISMLRGNFSYKPTAIAALPVSLTVLYAHAKSNEKLEDKFKLIESLVQFVNEASYLKVPLENTSALDVAGISLELFRFIKYFRKYLENKKQEQSIRDNDYKKNLNLSEKFKRLVKDFQLTEQEVMEMFEDDLFLFDDVPDNLENENSVDDLLDEDEDKNKPKGWLFKMKILACLFLLIDEFSYSVSHKSLNNDIVRPDFKDNYLVSKSLRYFLLSESGSWESRFSISLFFASFIKVLLRVVSCCNGTNYDSTGHDKNGYNFFGFNKDGYNRSGYNIPGFDVNGFDSSGYNKFGYDAGGFNSDGFDKFGWDKNGLDSVGRNKLVYCDNEYSYKFLGIPEEVFNELIDPKYTAMKFLKLGEGFSYEGLRARYKEFSTKWHPDKNGGSGESTEMSKKINNHYEILKEQFN